MKKIGKNPSISKETVVSFTTLSKREKENINGGYMLLNPTSLYRSSCDETEYKCIGNL